MSAAHRIPHGDETGDDQERPAAACDAQGVSPAAGPPFDWQVLLLRYLPQPVGSTHVIKRLAPR
jgi:hypothetical protein